MAERKIGEVGQFFRALPLRGEALTKACPTEIVCSPEAKSLMPYSQPAKRVSNHDGGGGLDVRKHKCFSKKKLLQRPPTPGFARLPGQILSIRVVFGPLLRLALISVKNLSKKAPAGHVRMVQNHVFPQNVRTLIHNPLSTANMHWPP